jgi:hypothetical protein
MTEPKWIMIREVSGDLIAESLRGLLEAQGIPVYLNQEGAGRAYGLNVGSLGSTQILVPEEFENQALKVLSAYDHGQFEDEHFSLDLGDEDDPDSPE